MAQGLDYAHRRGIVHSDFKPGNVFLTKQGSVKIFDFGIARAAKRADQASGEMTLFDAGTLGALTPAYASVSMVEGGDPDIRDDIYALGCVAYELLTGRHPYNKRSALKARNAGMELEQIPGLNRRQWHAMQKVLAYEREEQPQSVREFMDGLKPRAIDKTLLAAGAVAVVLLIIILATWVPSWLQERHLERLAATIESGDAADIALILPELETELTPAEQSVVYRDNPVTRDLLLRYFEHTALAATDYRNGRYDFAETKSLVGQADRLFPDSVRIAALEAEIDARNREAIAFVNDQFQLALERNVLIPEQGPNSALEYREVLARLDPGHDPVTGDSLPLAFARQGRVALSSGELPMARALVTAAITISPDDSGLLNLRAAVDSAFEEYDLEQKIAALDNQLASLDQASTLGEYQQLLRSDHIDRFWLETVWQVRARLDEDPPFLAESEREIGGLITAQVDRLTTRDQLAEARALLNRAQALFADDTLLRTAGRNLQAAELDYQQRTAEREVQAVLLAREQSVRDQIGASNFEAADRQVAALRLDLPASDPFLVEEVPRLFADAYVEQAEGSGRAGRFETALEQLDQADAYVPGYARAGSARTRILGEIQARDAQPPASDNRERATLMAGSIGRTLTGSGSLNVGVLQSELQQLRNLSPADYDARVAGIVSVTVAHLDSLRDSDPDKARERLAAFQTLFPRSRELSSYTLRERRVSARVPQDDACANPAFAGLGQNNRAICRDELGQNKKGPRMVVVPAGGSSGERFAITKYEITISDYNAYCALSGNCSGRQDGEVALPLTNISINEARQYAVWLTDTTGFEYRLPNSDEWRYAAEAPGTYSPPKNFNCQLRGDSGLIKGLRLEDVRTGEMNGWGLQNQVGNAREWAQDDGAISALGGSFQDPFDSCEITLRVPHSGQPDAVTGFRLVRKIGGAS